MTLSKTFMIGLVAAGAVAVSTAAVAKTYVVCNQYDECWRVHEHYTTYPADVRIIYHDDAWWTTHEHDTHVHYRLLADPADDHGWYDKDGVWHPFAP